MEVFGHKINTVSTKENEDEQKKELYVVVVVDFDRRGICFLSHVRILPVGKIVVKKRPSTILKELRVELEYWQMRVRIDVRSLRGSMRKAKSIAAQMRKQQRKILKARK